MTLRALSVQEQKFVEEYVVDLDAQRAAIAAGYSAQTARTWPYFWVAGPDAGPRPKPHVYHAVQERLRARTARTEITQDRVLRELAKIGFSDLRKVARWRNVPAEVIGEGDSATIIPAHLEVDLFDSDTLDEDSAGAIQEISVVRGVPKLKLYDKNVALDKIARHLGMLVDKSEVNADIRVKIEGGLPDEDE